MKKFLLISLLILSANALSMNRIVNRASRVASRAAKINSVLKNNNLLRNICSNSKNSECCCCNLNREKRNSEYLAFKVFGTLLGVSFLYEVAKAKLG